nr:hypothetical protein [Sicyoidochytrium minutum DNA virus]
MYFWSKLKSRGHETNDFGQNFCKQYTTRKSL